MSASPQYKWVYPAITFLYLYKGVFTSIPLTVNCFATEGSASGSMMLDYCNSGPFCSCPLYSTRRYPKCNLAPTIVQSNGKTPAIA